MKIIKVLENLDRALDEREEREKRDYGPIVKEYILATTIIAVAVIVMIIKIF